MKINIVIRWLFQARFNWTDAVVILIALKLSFLYGFMLLVIWAFISAFIGSKL